MQYKVGFTPSIANLDCNRFTSDRVNVVSIASLNGKAICSLVALSIVLMFILCIKQSSNGKPANFLSCSSSQRMFVRCEFSPRALRIIRPA